MHREILKALFRTNLFTVDVNTRDVTPADSERVPPGGGNSLNWVLGHIVASRGLVLAALAQEPVLTAEQAAPYTRGSSGTTGPWLPMEHLERALKRSQVRLEKGLAAISDEALARPLPADTGLPPGFLTEGDRLAFLHFHEAYHCGQIGLLRRQRGHAGAIG